jgi:predicted acylesterase/phospholipase RssA
MSLTARDVRPDLAERYRQVRPYDQAEVSLVEALVRRPDRLGRRQELTLRHALNLARVWVLRVDGHDVPVGPRLGVFRDHLRPLVDRLIRTRGEVDPRDLGRDAAYLESIVDAAGERVLSEHAGRVSAERLDEELSRKHLVLALGGGGGCGYVHLGAFALLDALRIQPAGIVGTSIGALLGLFRAHGLDTRSSLVRTIAFDLRFKDLFRILDAETRYALPGALRLHLRSGLERFFLDDDGEPLRMTDLRIPFVSVVAGVRREAFETVRPYEREFRRVFRRGTLGRLMHIKDVVSDLAKLLRDLAGTPGALETIPIGADPLTQDFDAVDAVGFSASLPALLQYDLTREDAHMNTVLAELLHREGVDALADGGLVANVPARIGWEMIQSGRLGSRNGMVLGLDCFPPSFGRHLLFLPLQRIAAENVNRDRHFAQLLIRYRRVPGPLNVLPRFRTIEQATKWGREDISRLSPTLLKMLEPLPPRFGLARKTTFQ